MAYQPQRYLGTWQEFLGGYFLLGFTKKDAYNYIEKSKCDKITDGDTNAAIKYLEGKATADLMSMARYNLTNDGMLANLFWADGASRFNYQYFGDVLAFDLTYKRNKYKRPLVIFSGTNNHKQTTIFGFGLVLDERIPSYTWMLESLVEVMCDKRLSVVVTDGNDAMIAAVRKVFPRATHRLCAWHLQRNVTSNSNEEMFRDVFAKWLYADMKIVDFEAKWAQAVIDFELSDKLWDSQMYEKREMWANAYLQDKFCVGFQTTSRCEGINTNVKKFLTSRHSILELVQNLELLVREYQNNELLAQFNTLYSMPVITSCLDSIERCAAKVYTRAVFNEVKKEIDRVGTVNFVSRRKVSTIMLYITEDYGNLGRRVMTLFEKNVVKLECRCRFWERVGYPCRHMFFVMKYEHLDAIPDRLIIKRWRKDAKDIGLYIDDIEEDSERGFLLRHGAFHASSQWMLFVGAKKQELFRVALNGIRNVCKDLENGNAKAMDSASKRVEVGIKDPVVVRTKGAPSSKKSKSKKIRCTTCRNIGHTKRRCTVSRRTFDETDVMEGADIFNTEPAEVKNVEVEYKKRVTRVGVDVDVLEEHHISDHKFNGDRIVCTAQSQNMQSLGDQNDADWETKVMDILRKLNPGTEAKSGSTR